MNGDMAPMEDLYTKVPVSKLALGIFVVITNWAIFSIMTAVVSDNMARVTQATEEEDEAERTRYRTVCAHWGVKSSKSRHTLQCSVSVCSAQPS